MATTAAQGRGARILSLRREALCAGLGILVAAGAVLLGVPDLAALLGWIVTAAAAVGWVWRLGWPQDHRGTRRLAAEESRSRSTDTVVLLAAVASLVAVALALLRSSDAVGARSTATAILAVLASVASWGLVNTVFALKYARSYYVDGAEIDFKQQTPPAYSDFAYLAFTVGMSYAVSDTEPASSAVRRLALGHALLSYLFGTVVLAVAINLVTNLGQG
jgi:uncharacterized membrane protein